MSKKTSLPFGLSVRTLVGGGVVVLFFSGTLWALNRFSSGNTLDESRPVTAALTPLQPVTRTSVIVAPVAVAALAIRDAMEANAPRNLAGKNENPLADLLGKADIGWTVSRGALAVNGAANGLNISTTLNGSLRVTGQLANQGGNLTGALGGLLGNKLGGEVQKLATRALDQRADIRGNVTVNSRPALLPTWRIEPNLGGNVALADGGVTVAGIKLNVSNEVKPLLDKTVSEQIGSLSNRLRNDASLESAARKQWGQMCRSIPLGQASPARRTCGRGQAHPRFRRAAENPRRLGDPHARRRGRDPHRAERDQARLPVPGAARSRGGTDQGKVTLGVPIDVPFTELNRVMELQLKGKTFPETGNAPGQVTVLASSIAAAGERLLISLRVKAKETKSWFGLGAEATVHIWGKPVLDRKARSCGWPTSRST